MGQITYADAIAIFQLVYYSPCLFGSIFVAGRHGALKSSGWIFLTIFCVVRIVGASAGLATISKPHSDTPYTIALVCSVLGLSPLLMASLGLISRAYVLFVGFALKKLISCRYYSILKQPWSTVFSFVIVKIVHVPAVVALILCIVGATNASSPAKIESESTVHIGIILYTVVFVMLVALTFGACLAKRRTGEGKGLLVFAILCALPFIFVRLLYALLAAFAHLSSINPVIGSRTAELFMSVLEEMVVVVIYIATGLKLSAVPAGAADSPGGTLAYRLGRGDFGTGRLGMFSLGTAVFQAFSNRSDVENQQPGSEKQGRGMASGRSRRR